MFVEHFVSMSRTDLADEFSGLPFSQVIGADIQTRRRYLAYQVFAVFLKFDFFFGVAFAMSFLILVANSNDWEYAVTIAALPAAIIVLFLASLAAKKEIKSLMAFAIACFLAGAVYFIYKVRRDMNSIITRTIVTKARACSQITRIYDPSTRASYQTVRLSLTFFSIFATVSCDLNMVPQMSIVAYFRSLSWVNRFLYSSPSYLLAYVCITSARACDRRTNRSDGDFADAGRSTWLHRAWVGSRDSVSTVLRLAVTMPRSLSMVTIKRTEAIMLHTLIICNRGPTAILSTMTMMMTTMKAPIAIPSGLEDTNTTIEATMLKDRQRTELRTQAG